MLERGQPHRKRMLLSAMALSVVLLFSVSVTAYAMSSRNVTIRDDGQSVDFNTTKGSANDILQARGISLNNDDYLDLSDFSTEEDCTIRIYRAKVVYLSEDGEARRLKCAGTVQRLLDLNGVVLGERDVMNARRTDLLENGMHIVIERAFDIAVLDEKEDYSLTLTSGTVAQALELCGVVLVDEDYVEPGGDTLLEPGMTIHVYRVSYKERKVNSEIAYEKTTKKDAKLELGMTRVERKGEYGEKEEIFQDKYINGERVSSLLLQETILKQPVAEIKIQGTKHVKLVPGLTPISKLSPPASLQLKDGVPTSYTDIIVGTAKAYSGDSSTAVGIKPKPGYIAVNPKQIPYGTQLWIVSNDGKYVYGYAIAADTGGFVKTNSCTVDLYMDTVSQCYQWGHRGVTIYVLDLPRVSFR
ncbi:MAG: ubiquitin-like domain-containing protein [Oscillospiraceae bacterium]|nr:ubiquitin-like domain-containing protein [Oscillospiraceae bacterium]